MKITVLQSGNLQVNCSIITNNTNNAIIVDPGLDFPKIEAYLHANHLIPRYVLHTHGHFDHIGMSVRFQEEEQSELFLHEEDTIFLSTLHNHAKAFGENALDLPSVDRTLQHNEELDLEGLKIQVLHTPGHSPGSVCFYLKEHDLLITGDTLFHESIGRTDLPGGNHEQLIQAIKSHILSLPSETECIPGHGPNTSLKHERDANPFLR